MFQGGLLLGTYIPNPIQYDLSKDRKHTPSKLSTIGKPAKPLGTEITSDHQNTSSSSSISLWLFVAAFPEVWCHNCQHKRLQSCNVRDNDGTSSECSMGHSWDAPGPCNDVVAAIGPWKNEAGDAYLACQNSLGKTSNGRPGLLHG